MDILDLGPATRVTAAVVRGVTHDQLSGRTPCPAYSVADLVDHIGGLTVAFTHSARKEPIPGAGAPSADGSRLEPGWRDRIDRDLAALAEAWSDPAALDGMTQAGPIEMPAEVAVLVALDEVVVHGWDLARATGQPYHADPASVAACREFVASFEPPAEGAEDPADGGLFGPPVPMPDHAPALDQLVGGTGRDPHWTP